MDITPDTRLAYWGYWARHIRVMRYEPPALPPYVDLARLLRGRDWFIASTNADGQARKLGLDEARIYTPQGDYALFQCALPCREQVYDNRAFVDAMLAPAGRRRYSDPGRGRAALSALRTVSGAQSA